MLRVINNNRNKKLKSRKQVLKCDVTRKFTNHLMRKGKKQKTEKFIYSVFSMIKRYYGVSGVLFLYEAVSLLFPVFLLVPVKISKKVYLLPTALARHKKYQIAIYEFARSIKQAKQLERGRSLVAVLTESILLIVFENQNTALKIKHDRVLSAVTNKTFLHYRW